MDTRTKIVGLNALDEMLSHGGVVGVAGAFDALTLAEAEQVSAVSEGASVLAIVEPGANPLLETEARAALVAALRSVQFVAIASRAEWQAKLAQYPAVRVLCDDAGEARRRQDFEAHLVRRQQAVNGR